MTVRHDGLPAGTPEAPIPFTFWKRGKALQKRYLSIAILTAVLAVTGIAGYLLPAGPVAGDKEPATRRILFDNAGGPVVFDHQKHSRLLKEDCATCHHESLQKTPDKAMACASCHGVALDDAFSFYYQANLDALVPCGFNLCTTAGNHAHDNGVPGIVDTIAHLKERGIAVTGSGRTLPEAKAPAVVTRKGVTVAVLAYNAVGPREGWATSKKAGVSYVNILTHHEPSPRATPGLPATIYTFPEPESLKQMQSDIAALRPHCDILLVALHKGMVHLDSVIQMYEIPLSHAAIDAGADAVIGHHAHILRGIEVYRGRPIYHNLGNFVCVTHALTPTADNDSPERLAWIASRKKLFGFEPDMTMPYYPFNPDSRNTKRDSANHPL